MKQDDRKFAKLPRGSYKFETRACLYFIEWLYG